MDLPIVGEQLTVSSSNGYVITLGAGAHELHIEGELAVHSPSGPTLRRIAGEPHTEDVASAVAGEIVSATVTSTGELRIDLDSGNRLVVEPDRYFEAWNITAPGKYLVVCMPGGELAIWSEDT
ncbi:DUF6188 family protein [Nocardia jejuensis]|uniref:DUF6188 family protein n=1 Tax=Nocardia jejuensis TaxID=328049 RepID=UPI00082B5C05|nr:DUF6188 family protein [Nocardia jejuensis]